jgi:hypothetical protein
VIAVRLVLQSERVPCLSSEESTNDDQVDDSGADTRGNYGNRDTNRSGARRLLLGWLQPGSGCVPATVWP